MPTTTATAKRRHGNGKVSGTDRPTEDRSLARETDDSRTTQDDFVKKTLLRRCLPHIKYLVAIMLIPPFLNYVALLQESAQLMPPGALYDVGFGHKMYLGCNGTGSPTVIFDAGLGASSDSWWLAYQDVSKFTKTCVYDRAGIGFSARPYQNNSKETELQGRDRWKLYTIERMVDDFHTLMSYSSQQPRPFLLVGAEIGSLVARFYTQVYESDVAGLLLVNPLPEDLFSYDNHIWSDYWLRRLVPKWQTMQLLAALGYTRLAMLFKMHDIPLMGHAAASSELVNRQKHLLCNPRHLSSVVDEHYFINETFSQMQTIFRMKSFPVNVSVTVISSSTYDSEVSNSLNQAWEKAQQNLVSRLHPNSERVVVDDADRGSVTWRRADVIVQQIRRMVLRYRSQHRQD